MIPGGNAFHSVRYWAEGNGGYSPYLSERPLAGFKLELLPPEAAPVFAFGQPVLLGLQLTNTSTRPIQVPNYLLDPKAGFIEIAIRRLDLSDRDRRNVRNFTPIITRCFDVAADVTHVLRPGESTRDNLNLTFGASGFPFAEPGFYEVTAYLVIYQHSEDRELVVPSQPLRIRIAAPENRDEEREAMTLFNNEVGRYFVLGGTVRGGAETELENILDRRFSQKRVRDKDMAPRDPVAVNIIRSRAFRLGRTYHSRDDGAIKLFQKSDLATSLRELELLDDKALTVFDPVTAASTRAYVERLRKEK
jgi:hypothetical protein